MRKISIAIFVLALVFTLVVQLNAQSQSKITAWWITSYGELQTEGYSMSASTGAPLASLLTGNNMALDSAGGFVSALVSTPPTATPTATPTAKPTATPTAKPTATPTATPVVPIGTSGDIIYLPVIEN